MTTAVEIYARDFFRIIGTIPHTKFWVVCIKHSNRTANNRRIKSNLLLAMLYENHFKYFPPNK